MDPRYVEKIQEWVKLDNQLLRVKDSTSDIQQKKKDLEEDILEFISKNKLEALTINISDGTIKFSSQNTKTPLNMKSLKTILDKYSSEECPINVDEIIKYISNNLETKTRSFIKRDVKNGGGS